MKMMAASGVIALGLMFTSAQAQTTANVVGNADNGRSKVAMCIGCHGIPDYKASFPEVYRVPKIAGQNAGYITNALHEYQKGDRKHPTMHGIAQSLSEQDIADVAAYYSQKK